MKANNQENDENDSDDIYISDEDDGINYVQEGEDFDAQEARRSDSDDDSKQGALVESMNENDLAAQIDRAQKDAVVSRQNVEFVKAAKLRGSGQEMEISALEQLKNMITSQGTVMKLNNKLYSLDDSNLLKDLARLQAQARQNSSSLQAQRSKSGLTRMSKSNINLEDDSDKEHASLHKFCLEDQNLQNATVTEEPSLKLAQK